MRCTQASASEVAMGWRQTHSPHPHPHPHPHFPSSETLYLEGGEVGELGEVNRAAEDAHQHLNGLDRNRCARNKGGKDEMGRRRGACQH